MDEARATFEAGLQAYRPFNYYATKKQRKSYRANSDKIRISRAKLPRSYQR